MLKKFLLAIAAFILFCLLVVAGYVAYISATWQKDYSAIEKPAIQASTDPEVIKRGEYVAHALAHCSICHAPLEATMNRKPGDRPAMPGGFEWKMGPVGTLYSRNITPDNETGIGAWTDGELARAIKWGIGKDGKALTFMVFSAPALADEDLLAVVSYLRSTAPVKQQNKPHDVGFLGKWMASLAGPDFRKPFFEGLKYAPPAAEPSIERGAYLARGPAACIGCHSPFDMMSMKVSGAEFSGNTQAEPDKDDENMVYRIPNLTPDPKTGHIAKWDEERFVKRFQAGRVYKSSKMPWEAFREMSDADMRSVYRYLKTLPPAVHYVGASHRPASEDPEKDPR